MSLIDIFLSFLKIGSLAFGGAYAAMPLVEQQIVKVKAWMSYEEFLDLVAIDELTPGPILVNSATYIGMKLAGIPGAIVATLGCIVPACIVSLVLIYLYKKYKDIPVLNEIILMLKCMSVAMIASTVINIFLNAIFPGSIYEIKNMNVPVLLMTFISFYALEKHNYNPIYLILGSGLINLIINSIQYLF